MNRTLLLSLVATPVLALAACALEEEPPVTPVGGASSVGGSGGSGAPVSGSTSGGAPVGGSGVAGSNSAGVAGTVQAQGGVAGAATTAGAAGTAVTAGTAGMASGGMAGSATMGGTAGSATMGGTAGETATAGAPAGGSGGSAPMPITVTELVGKLDGHLITMPCGDTPSTDDCKGSGWIYNGKNTPCSGTTLDSVVEYPINGTPGKTYNATMHFYGVMEPKNYGPNAVREAGTTRPNNANSGATPVPWATARMPGQAYQASNYNTYEIHVFNNNNQEVGTYYLNSDTGEGHYTFVIDYSKTIPLIGGGRVRLRIFDANCRQIKNCAGGGYPCASKARSIAGVSQAMPAPGAALNQPGMGQTADHSGQWFLLDVTNVVEAP